MTESPFKKGRAWIGLDIENLRHNVTVLKSMLPEGCQLMPAVKADAYGHGAVLVSKELNNMGVQAFCVATVVEGVELRENGIIGEILILGYTHPEQFYLLAEYNLTQAVVDFEYAKQLNSFGQLIQVHIAIDSGMHRIGERCENLEHILEMFRMDNLMVSAVFTHLCAADSKKEKDIAFTIGQIEAFQNLIYQLYENGFTPKTHILNSSGLLNYPECCGDYVRVGIALYGVPSTREDMQRYFSGIRPVLSVNARVSSVRQLHKGEGAGYGLAFTAEEDMDIAALSIGYADGLPRCLSCGVGSVLVNGCKAPIIGQICMDQTLVDVSGVSCVSTGDTAVLIGTSGDETISICEVAEEAGTISNEIMSRLSQRLERTVCK